MTPYLAHWMDRMASTKMFDVYTCPPLKYAFQHFLMAYKDRRPLCMSGNYKDTALIMPLVMPHEIIKACSLEAAIKRISITNDFNYTGTDGIDILGHIVYVHGATVFDTDCTPIFMPVIVCGENCGEERENSLNIYVHSRVLKQDRHVYRCIMKNLVPYVLSDDFHASCNFLTRWGIASRVSVVIDNMRDFYKCPKVPKPSEVFNNDSNIRELLSNNM